MCIRAAGPQTWRRRAVDRSAIAAIEKRRLNHFPALLPGPGLPLAEHGGSLGLRVPSPCTLPGDRSEEHALRPPAMTHSRRISAPYANSNKGAGRRTPPVGGAAHTPRVSAPPM